MFETLQEKGVHLLTSITNQLIGINGVTLKK